MKRDSGLTRPFRTPHLKATCSAIRRKRGLKSPTVLTAQSAGAPAADEVRHREDGMTRLNWSIHFDNTNKDQFRVQRRRRPSAALDRPLTPQRTFVTSVQCRGLWRDPPVCRRRRQCAVKRRAFETVGALHPLTRSRSFCALHEFLELRSVEGHASGSIFARLRRLCRRARGHQGR